MGTNCSEVNTRAWEYVLCLHDHSYIWQSWAPHWAWLGTTIQSHDHEYALHKWLLHAHIVYVIFVDLHPVTWLPVSTQHEVVCTFQVAWQCQVYVYMTMDPPRKEQPLLKDTSKYFSRKTTHCHIWTSEKRTTSIQRTTWLPPKCPLFGGSTVITHVIVL